MKIQPQVPSRLRTVAEGRAAAIPLARQG
jgi:hypothetical protein